MLMGILRGFADQAEPARHLVLRGTGQGYCLITDGVTRLAGKTLDEAFSAFNAAAASLPDHWVEVRGMTVSALANTPPTITDFGTRLLGECRQTFTEGEPDSEGEPDAERPRSCGT